MRYWVRHGLPDVANGICYGQLDLPLAESPMVTAVRLAEQLPLAAPIYCSPLYRCHALAEALADLAGEEKRPLLMAELMELDFGHWEGVAWDDIPRQEIDAWAADPFGYQIPGGEAIPAFVQRVARGLSRLPAGAIVVTHAGVIRAAYHLCGQIPLPEAYDLVVPYGSALSF